MKSFYYCLAFLLVIHGCNKTDSYLSTKITISEAKQSYNNVITTFNLSNSPDLNDSLPQKIEWETSYERKISGESCLILNINPSSKKQINKENNKYSS
ncbi:hypothetical protein, partial [Chitinophaga sp.]|uniref:hypothetical protein n=1 Tax=Chitinophaga sp. TaxID=1869181 RepID=UPI002F91C1C6